MAIPLSDLLHPFVVLDTISRIKRGRGTLGQWFKFHANKYDAARGVLVGANTTPTPTRSGTYRIYDHVRTVAQARAPGTGPALIAQNPVGDVSYTCIRFHEKMQFFAEQLAQMSKIIGPNTMIDEGGQDYIGNQLNTMAERGNNAIELTAWAMCRGTLYLKPTGENWLPTLTDPSSGVTVDFKIPSGNKSKLDMLGAGDIIGTSWDNAAAPILTDLLQINAAFVELTGGSLTDVWVSSVVWGYIIANTQVINAAGSAATPFQTFERTAERDEDGLPISQFTATLRGLPTVTFHISDEVLTDPGTGSSVKMVPDTNAIFTAGEPDKSWVDYLTYAEHVSEQPGQPMVQKAGWAFWNEWRTQPTCVEVLSLFNGIPRLKRPKSIAYGLVKY